MSVGLEMEREEQRQRGEGEEGNSEKLGGEENYEVVEGLEEQYDRGDDSFDEEEFAAWLAESERFTKIKPRPCTCTGCTSVIF